MNDPLGALIVDSKEVDRTRLAACLSGLAGVDGTTGDPVLMDGFGRLGSARKKILVYLLATKASFLLEKNTEEGAGPTQISQALGIPMGTVGRTLRELADDRVLVQDHAKRYIVPSHRLLTVEDEVSGGA